MNSWSLETDLVTRGLREDPGVAWGPRGRGGARRFSLDPEIVFGAQRFPYTMRSYMGLRGPSLDPGILTGARRRSGDRIGTLGFYPFSKVIFRPLRPYRNPEVSSLDPEIFDWNPDVLKAEPGGSSLDPEIFDWNPEAIGEPEGPGVPWEAGIFYFSEGPYSASLGKATTGTCLDFAFCRSEAGHYRVPMLYSTSAESH
ncbi:hypothetical protein F2Q69_00059526 [Brassica cretica]|uniref:Uncharacterized protein n=1 Tax=Brassica cretica TaxID=69181 RepID=A0A8S9RJI3_BRACR|nr:hypothetical protein F2Q69_00059526 [Brassica cretica]